jgi:hypothetical protein
VRIWVRCPRDAPSNIGEHASSVFDVNDLSTLLLNTVGNIGKGKDALAGKLNAPSHFLPECAVATEGTTRAEHRGITSILVAGA